MDTALYRLRAYRPEDREAAARLGKHVVDWWNKVPGAFLHLVVDHIPANTVIGHLQAVDRSLPEPSRRPGEIQIRLIVAEEHRRHRIGTALMQEVEDFARKRQARRLYLSYTEGEPGEYFLKGLGFEEFERFLPSHLDLANFDPATFANAIPRAEAQGFRLLTYSELADTAENRRRLYVLEQTTRADVPFHDVKPFVPKSFDEWLAEYDWEPETVFLAVAPNGDFAGIVQGLEWNYTGILPEYRGRGLALALKVKMLTAAKERGIERLQTENHADNAPMLAINRKLGFVFGAPEVVCIKRY